MNIVKSCERLRTDPALLQTDRFFETMGYLYLFLALTAGLIKAYCGKKSSAAANCSYNAIIINIARMFLCVIIGALFVLMRGASSFAFTTPKVILIALLGGIGTSLFTVCWLLAVHTNAYMIIEVFVMGGVVIPLTLCIILYKEPIGILQIAGILLLLIAVYYMCTSRKKGKIALSFRSFLLLLLCAVSSGISDFSQKLYVKEIKNVDISVFNFYMYLIAATVLFIIYLFFRSKQKNLNKTKTTSTIINPIFPYIVIMAVCLFLNSYFKTNSAKYIDAVLLYPLNQCCAVVLSLAMSIAVFKEKTTARGIIGITLSVISIILINLPVPA